MFFLHLFGTIHPVFLVSPFVILFHSPSLRLTVDIWQWRRVVHGWSREEFLRWGQAQTRTAMSSLTRFWRSAKYPSETTLSLYVVKGNPSITRSVPATAMTLHLCSGQLSCGSLFTRFRCVRIVGGEHMITYVIALIKNIESAYNGTSIRWLAMHCHATPSRTVATWGLT